MTGVVIAKSLTINIENDNTIGSHTARKIAEQSHNLKSGDKIVITGGVITGESGNTNLIKIEDI